MHVLLERRLFGADDLEHWTASLQGLPCHAWLVPEDVLPAWSRARTFHYDSGRVLIVDHPIAGFDLLTLLMAFEHACNGSLDHHKRAFGLGTPLPLATAVSIALEAARALPDHPHRGRLISPVGVLIGRDGHVQLASPELMDLAKTMFNSWVGNPIQRLKMGSRYVSRQAALGQPNTPAADTFSLAAMLYELAAGRHPFIEPSTTDFAFLEAVKSGAITPPSTWVPGIPTAIDDVLLDALGPDESRHFADPGAFALALVQAIVLPTSPAQEVAAFVRHLWPHLPPALHEWRSPFCLDPSAS
jgi:serine/threonine protein kinase